MCDAITDLVPPQWPRFNPDNAPVQIGDFYQISEGRGANAIHRIGRIEITKDDTIINDQYIWRQDLWRAQFPCTQDNAKLIPGKTYTWAADASKPTQETIRDVQFLGFILPASEIPFENSKSNSFLKSELACVVRDVKDPGVIAMTNPSNLIQNLVNLSEVVARHKAVKTIMQLIDTPSGLDQSTLNDILIDLQEATSKVAVENPKALSWAPLTPETSIVYDYYHDMQF